MWIKLNFFLFIVYNQSFWKYLKESNALYYYKNQSL